MYLVKKRGLSPIVATVLLIALALVLAVIVYLWARSIIGESAEKNGSDISNSCELTKFTVDAVMTDGGVLVNRVYIGNTGTVPIYCAEIRKSSGLGGIKKAGNFGGDTIVAGETGEIEFDYGAEGLSAGDSITVIPILLGESKGKHKTFVCEKDYGLDTQVRGG